MRLGGIEFGGTKTVCVVGTAGQVEDEVRFATGADPAANLATCVEFFRRYDDVAAVGVGAFGPCDPDPTSPTYGFVTTTPKPGWADVDVLGALREGLPGVALAFDTDVNVAALGELVHGAGKGLNSVVYLTTGTGIGGGLVADGHLVHGLLHPEMGHIPILRPLVETEVFAGVCPYHGDCLEGVASGPALAARWGSPAQDIGPDDDRYEVMWDLEAQYLAAAMHTFVCIVSPQRIISGGGVGQQEQLLQRVRPRLQESLNGYIHKDAILHDIDSYVVAPQLGNHSGGIGAMELALRALGESLLPTQSSVVSTAVAGESRDAAEELS